MIMTVKYTQIESGLLQPILEHPSVHIPYMTPTWTTSLRQFLYQHNLTITLTDQLAITPKGRHDHGIMNLPYLEKYSLQQQIDINLVRLHLQITVLSDMTIDAHNACPYNCEGQRRPNQRLQITNWPRQDLVTASQTKLWKSYLSDHFLKSSTKWRHPVIDDRRPTPAPLAATAYESLSEYLDSLPIWYQRLLFDYTQEATDVDIWRVFRSRIRLTIVTDGSLLPTAGTFGWKLVTPKKKVLFTGSGPIDGPIEIGSSTRSELGGFTGPLLLVTLLARFWGLRHRCRFW